MARRDEGFFSARDNTRLYWQSALPDGEPPDIVGIVHGFGDHSHRYDDTIADLVSKGHGVMAFDYRGHGRADGPRGDVQKWPEYLEDLDVFWAKVRTVANGKPTFLLGHSFGALIATHWAAKKPEGLKGLILSSPWFKLAFEPPAMKLLAAKVLKVFAPGLKLGNELKPEQLSRDPVWQQKTAADPLYLHSVTPRWFFESQAMQEALAGKGASISVPVMVVAGTADPISLIPAAKAFFPTLASTDKTWKDYADFRHEVLNEVGKEQVVADISQWISTHR